MNQQINTGFRILARDIAQELTQEEIEQVSGGTAGSCTTVSKATWSQQNGADVEFVLQCTY